MRCYFVDRTKLNDSFYHTYRLDKPLPTPPLSTPAINMIMNLKKKKQKQNKRKQKKKDEVKHRNLKVNLFLFNFV